MAENIQGSSTPELLNLAAATQLQGFLNSTTTLNDFVNTPLASVINEISNSSSLDDTSAVQITLLTMILRTQEIILDKINKDHETMVNQFSSMGKAFCNNLGFYKCSSIS
jgi:hypothetical protein